MKLNSFLKNNMQLDSFQGDFPDTEHSLVTIHNNLFMKIIRSIFLALFFFIIQFSASTCLGEKIPVITSIYPIADMIQQVGRDHVVFGDDDGVVFTPLQHIEEVISSARTIWDTERRQADEIKAGKRLHQQLQFDEYLKERSQDPTYTFRKHLQKIGGAIEV